MNRKIIVGVTVVAVVALALGIFFSYRIISPPSSGSGKSSLVQVSGSVQYPQITAIEFKGVTTSSTASSSITNGSYSVLLVAGQSYNVFLYNYTDYVEYSFTIHVPSDVTTLTENFGPTS